MHRKVHRALRFPKDKAQKGTMRKLRILALSDFGSTGIAESLATPLLHWHDLGHEIWHLCAGYNGWNYGVDKVRWPWLERMLPINFSLDTNERFGQKLIGQALIASQADILISAFDVWMITYLSRPEADPTLSDHVHQMIDHSTRNFRHIAYFPLDGGTPDNHLGQNLDEVIAGFDFPVTYSRFAQKMVYHDTHLQIPMIPIGHNPDIFKPGDKMEARKRLGLPEDKFIVGMVATNQYRKLWGQFVSGAAPFLKNHPDAMILPWTTWDYQMHGGSLVSDLIWRYDVMEQTLNPGNITGHFRDEHMADLYRSMDVCVLLTVGEGAGLPPLRARACGTPVLVSNNTSNIEFSTDDFELVPDAFSYFDAMGSNFERYFPDVPTFTRKLEELYADPSLRERLSLKGIAGMQQYENDRLLPYWDDLLERAAGPDLPEDIQLGQEDSEETEISSEEREHQVEAAVAQITEGAAE